MTALLNFDYYIQEYGDKLKHDRYTGMQLVVSDSKIQTKTHLI
jgi:hypothetical protein